MSENNHEAFQTLFGMYKPRLYSYAIRMLKTHEEAEELVQETFIKLWLKRDVLTTIDRPEQFIFTIIRNISIDHLRKIALDGRLRMKVWQHMNTPVNSTEETIFANESDQLVRKAFQKLSPHKQAIFKLSRYDGLNHDQIAEKLQISKNTVKNQLVSSLRFMREYLARHFTTIIVLLAWYRE